MITLYLNIQQYRISNKVYFHYLCFFIFFFNDTATTEIYTLSLHDALPNLPGVYRRANYTVVDVEPDGAARNGSTDRKSTRLNSSHLVISYAVFCLKKKKLACIIAYL